MPTHSTPHTMPSTRHCAPLAPAAAGISKPGEPARRSATRAASAATAADATVGGGPPPRAVARPKHGAKRGPSTSKMESVPEPERELPRQFGGATGAWRGSRRSLKARDITARARACFDPRLKIPATASLSRLSFPFPSSPLRSRQARPACRRGGGRALIPVGPPHRKRGHRLCCCAHLPARHLSHPPAPRPGPAPAPPAVLSLVRRGRRGKTGGRPDGPAG